MNLLYISLFGGFSNFPSTIYTTLFSFLFYSFLHLFECLRCNHFFDTVLSFLFPRGRLRGLETIISFPLSMTRVIVDSRLLISDSSRKTQGLLTLFWWSLSDAVTVLYSNIPLLTDSRDAVFCSRGAHKIPNTSYPWFRSTHGMIASHCTLLCIT